MDFARDHAQACLQLPGPRWPDHIGEVVLPLVRASALFQRPLVPQEICLSILTAWPSQGPRRVRVEAGKSLGAEALLLPQHPEARAG